MRTTRLFLVIFCLLLVAGWLGACSDDDDPAAPAAKDTTPPEVIATFPEDGRGGVSVDADLTVIFSEGMDEDSALGNITLTGGTITDMEWYSDRILEIAHGDFTEETNLTLTVGTGLKDLAGNGMTEAHAVEFLTESDNLILMSMSPADDAGNVHVNTGITLKFSESVSTGNIENWVILSDNIVTKANVPDKVNFDFEAGSMADGTYLLTPDADLPDETLIYVYVSDQLVSYSGHSPAEPYLNTFTTGTGTDTTPPTIISVEPANGTMNVDPDQGFLRFTFSEPINERRLGFSRYNLGFLILVEFSEVGLFEWNSDFTVLTIGLPSDMGAGTPILFTLDEITDMNGVVQPSSYDYEVKVAGNADYLPFADGNRYVDNIGWEEGVLGNPMVQDDGNYYPGIEIEFQTDGSFREIEYEGDGFQSATGAWEAYRETGSALEWLGWEDAPEPPSKSNDFDPPLTVLPLPFSAGNWTDSGSVTVAGEGTFAGTLEGKVLPRQDYRIPEAHGEVFVKDAWIVVFDLDAELGGELAVAMHDTVIYAPAFGPVRMTSYDEHHGENEWRRETTWRWPFYDYMGGPRKSREFPRLGSYHD